MGGRISTASRMDIIGQAGQGAGRGTSLVIGHKIRLLRLQEEGIDHSITIYNIKAHTSVHISLSYQIYIASSKTRFYVACNVNRSYNTL
jgi:hypothetical protein